MGKKIERINFSPTYTQFYLPLHNWYKCPGEKHSILFLGMHTWFFCTIVLVLWREILMTLFLYYKGSDLAYHIKQSNKSWEQNVWINNRQCCPLRNQCWAAAGWERYCLWSPIPWSEGKDFSESSRKAGRCWNGALLSSVEIRYLQESGTALNTAGPGQEVGVARFNAVSPEAPSVMSSPDVHLQSWWLVGWPQQTDDNQGDGTTAS